MFKNAILNLDYGGHSFEAAKHALGLPISLGDQVDPNLIYILANKQKLTVLSIDRVKRRGENDKGEVFAITKQRYRSLTSPHHKDSIKLTPSINDILSERVSYSFATDIVLLSALFVTLWMLPVASLVFAPIVFFVSTMGFSLLRFRLSFGRWPNAAELSATVKYALDATISVIIPAGIYLLLTGASIFTPVILHTFSIGSITFGGPLVTYLFAPLLISTIIAAGVTIYQDAKLILNHFFDIQIRLHKSFPYVCTINLRPKRASLNSLLKSLVKTSLTQFSLYFVTALATVYPAYIPAGAIAVAIFGSGSGSAATASLLMSTIDVLGHAVIGLSAAIGLTYFSEKSAVLFSKLYQRIKRSSKNLFTKTDEPSINESVVRDELSVNNKDYSPMEKLADSTSHPSSENSQSRRSKQDQTGHELFRGRLFATSIKDSEENIDGSEEKNNNGISNGR